MEDFEKILRENPKAEREVEAIRDAMKMLNNLRKLGIARGPMIALGAYGGQGAQKLRALRNTKSFSK
jgi:hypothetical protein